MATLWTWYHLALLRLPITCADEWQSRLGPDPADGDWEERPALVNEPALARRKILIPPLPGQVTGYY